MTKPVLHMPDITMIHDGVIHALWKTQKMDTLDIAKKLNLRENQVATRLAQLKDEWSHRDVKLCKGEHA